MDDSVDPNPEQLRARGGYKWTFYPEDILPAWVAEMDFGLAPPIQAALEDALRRGDTGYPYPALMEQDAEAATGFWRERFGWEVEPPRVFFAPDVVEGLRRAIVHLTEAGSPVVLHTPVYYPFFSMVERAGRRAIQVPCGRARDGLYRLDLDGIVAALDEGAGCVVLCNPWNPTGRSLDLDELGDLVEVVRSRSARLISDEVHGPLTLPGARHIPVAGLDPETVVTVTSATKGWNLPGLKCAEVVLTNDRDIERWTDYFTMDKIGVGTFGLIANAAAYSVGRDWLDSVIALIDGNRALLGQLLAEHLPAAFYTAPDASYLGWIDFRSFGLDRPAATLLDTARVALSEGEVFGPGGEGHARLNFATYPSILTEIVERMAAAVG